MRTSFPGACLLALVLLPAAQGQTFDLKFKFYPHTGKSIEVSTVQKTTGSIKYIDKTGNVVNEDKYDETIEEKATETTLEKGKDYPNKFKRVYHKASTTANSEVTPASQTHTTIGSSRPGSLANPG